MNILLINHYAGSPNYGMEFRPYHMAKEWVKQGHNVTILASSYSHLRREIDINGKNKKENIDGVNYIWYKTKPYDTNGLGRVYNIFQFLKALWGDTKNIVKEIKPDVVIASSTYPMDIWGAGRIAKKAKAQLIFEVHDLWPLSPIELGGMSKNHPFIMICQRAEDFAYKHSDKVVSMLPNVHDYMKSRGLDLSKLSIVPNGIVEEDWADVNSKPLSEGPLKQFVTKVKEEGKKIVAYTGAHGLPNALDSFLDAAKLLQENKNVVFVLVGKGLEKDNLIEKKNREHIENVYFFDPISKYEIPSLLQYFDIAYIGLKYQPLFRFGVSPNKLMDYMMAGKPICYAINAGNNLVQDADCGISVEAENPQAIANGIRELLSLSDEERCKLGNNGKKYILKHQTYSKLAVKFLNTMQND
ncbi:glycosyltransferase family 4 protein [Riemerella columbipharyngis]|uniref:Glycosyltransferase involved in cell wall bisynthesis n=1 Tax=Riemerella columbipharyngis TaxID=1071918 RepID=A0A1G6YXD5_9FLAO|nr:glycosyltransferase family 4 protein [Riemerella columbipharyngis]SDD94723.1 Glycosyltransferase involved in cell wall bisynthesis [Riemerella columbipharyngis]